MPCSHCRAHSQCPAHSRAAQWLSPWSQGVLVPGLPPPFSLRATFPTPQRLRISEESFHLLPASSFQVRSPWVQMLKSGVTFSTLQTMMWITFAKEQRLDSLYDGAGPKFLVLILLVSPYYRTAAFTSVKCYSVILKLHGLVRVYHTHRIWDQNINMS